MSSNLTRCTNGHLFSTRRHGTICPYCNIETATPEKKETGISDTEVEKLLTYGDVEPVCGWLVCIEGPRQGKDYKIRDGKNFIGRADDMDIQILGDNQISRRNHAVIVFDKKKMETVLLPGDSSGIAYHNGNASYVPTPLGDYDVIEMGASRFLFVSFCGDHFMWGRPEGKPEDKPGGDQS